MSNNNDQGFDNWFNNHFGEDPPKPATPPTPEAEAEAERPVSPPAQPAQPVQPAAPPPPAGPFGGPLPAPPVVAPGQATPPQFTQFPTQQQPMQPPVEHRQPPPDFTQPQHPQYTHQPPNYTQPQQPQYPQQPPNYTQPQQFDAPMQRPAMPQQPPAPPEPAAPQAPAHPSFDPSLAGQDAVPTEFIPSANAAASAGFGETNALEALFGADQFHDYQLDPPPVATSGSPADSGDEPPAGISRTHITLMWVAGSAVALFALFAFFIVGTRLPFLTGSGTTPTDQPAPIQTDRPEGPVAPGTYNWNELLGGECLDDYRGAWENEYTVVDCSVPHAAQLVTRAGVPIEAGTGGAYPGVSELQSRMNLLCTDSTVVDYTAANEYDDIQFEASYPASLEEWDSGRRDYFCFVSRASGQPLEGSLAAPPASEEPLEDEGTDESTEEG